MTNSISLKSFIVEMKSQMLIIGPVLITFLMRRSISFVSLMFVARIGTAELSAIGLATVTANVTGFSMVIGLSGAVSTLCSQRFGAGDLVAMNAVLQRAVLIIVIFIDIPVSLMWWYSKDIMIFLGQDEHIAYNANAFLTYLIPGLFANSISICLQNWLHAQSRATAIAMVGIAVAFSHPLWCYFFVYVLKVGFRGAAIATTASQFFELAFIIFYVLCSDVKTKTQFAFSKDCFRDWWPFLSLGFPSLLMMMEWWAAETIIFLSGILPNPEMTVAAMAVYQSTLSMVYMFPLSVAVAGCTRVGNALGANFAFGARLGAVVSSSMSFLICILIAIILFTHRVDWAQAYSSDPGVIAIVVSILPVACIYVVCDGMQCVTSNILKGAGKQSFASPIVLLCYPCVAVPMSVLLGFRFNMGVRGLALGTLLGVSLHFILMVAVVANLDWYKVALAIQNNKKVANANTSKSVDGDHFNPEVDPEENLSYFQMRQREQQQLLLWEQTQKDTVAEWWDNLSTMLSKVIRNNGGNGDADADGDGDADNDDQDSNQDDEQDRTTSLPNVTTNAATIGSRVAYSLDDSTSTPNTRKLSRTQSNTWLSRNLAKVTSVVSDAIKTVVGDSRSEERREYELVRSATDSLSLDALEESDTE